MQAEETKVLKELIDMAEDYKDGALPSKTVALELEEMLPELYQLQEYIGALETDLEETNEELYEAESYYDALYEDYMNFQDEMMTEDEHND